MSKATFLFYDIETTGLNCCFDQIIDFAAIRTTPDLTEISRHEYTIRLNPDVIPSPEAMITHRIPLERILLGTKEYPTICEIHKLFNTPGTISVGYNSLGFDDEFMRFSFYRNLLAPYDHQFANDCGRIDLYPITVLYYLFTQDVDLTWPTVDGEISLKLENFNNENKWIKGQSHTAIVDVEVTIALAKKLYAKNTMWHYAVGYFDKQESIKRLHKLSTYVINNKQRQLALLINGKFGRKNHFQVPALYLGMHNHYKNQQIWLLLDDVDFVVKCTNDLASCFTINKKITEPPLFLPLIEKYISYISEARQEVIENNLQCLVENPEIFHKLCDIHLNFTYPEVNNLDLDAALYANNFPTPAEKKEQENFHKFSIADKTNNLDTLSNQNHRKLASRILLRNYPESVKFTDNNFNDLINTIYKKDLDEQKRDYKNKPHNNVIETLIRIDELKNTDLDVEQLKQLDDLKQYLLDLQNK
jgi:exodeoxyribonuclease-1